MFPGPHAVSPAQPWRHPELTLSQEEVQKRAWVSPGRAFHHFPTFSCFRNRNALPGERLEATPLPGTEQKAANLMNHLCTELFWKPRVSVSGFDAPRTAPASPLQLHQPFCYFLSSAPRLVFQKLSVGLFIFLFGWFPVCLILSFWSS